MYIANEHTFSSQRIYSKCSLCYMPSYFSSWESKLNNCWALEYISMLYIHLLLLELQILNNRLRLMVLIYLQWKNLGNHFALERFAKVLSGLMYILEILRIVQYKMGVVDEWWWHDHYWLPQRLHIYLFYSSYPPPLVQLVYLKEKIPKNVNFNHWVIKWHELDTSLNGFGFSIWACCVMVGEVEC